jgi:hypothetical protein
MSRHLRLRRRFRRNRRPDKAQALDLLSSGGRAFPAATHVVRRRSYATAPFLAAAPQAETLRPFRPTPEPRR